MENFIIVTNDDIKYYINIKYIVSIRAFKDGSALKISSSPLEMVVNETPSEILNNIYNAY